MHILTRPGRLLRDTKGVSALEFALIAPFVIGAGLFAASASFKILERQKLDSAVISAAYYLEDRVLSGDWEAFQPLPPKTGEETGADGPVLTTTRLVLDDAYKSSASMTIRKLDVFCGCPQSLSAESGQLDEAQPFYTRYAVETVGEREICSTPCADRTEARILAEIEVVSTNKDMFGETYILEKKLVTRLR